MSSHDTIGRRPRDKRVSTGKRVTPRPRDLLWFEKLAQHGSLSSSHLHEFSKHLNPNPRDARYRARDLYHEDNTLHGGAYLSRPHQQFGTMDARYQELVYDLTPSSEKALADIGITPVSHAGWFVHQFMTAHITASIDLATDGFIPLHEITDQPLSVPIGEKTLTPDAMFGIKYGDNRRVFLLEADRGTEVIRSNSKNRKTKLQNFKQYRKLIGQELYKKHYSINSGLMLLYVTVSETHMNNLIDLLMELSNGKGNNYILFKTIPHFTRYFKPPKPQLDLFTEPWMRAGHSDFWINQS